MEIFKKIKTQIKGIINIEEKFKLIQLLYQENQISKYRLQILYEQMKAQFEENNQIRIWFLEQFATYEKNNFQLISQICDYYLEQSNQEQAYKYLQLIIGQSINDLNFREIEQQYQLVKSEKKIILNQIQEIEQEIKKSQSNDLIQLSRDLIMLKNEIGQPISDLVYNYQQLSSYYRDQKNYKQAISTLQECLDKIKAEQLINYNPELLYFESTSLELLGDCLRQINETQEALNAYIDSIQIKKEIKKLDPRKLILIKKRISGLYYKQKQYQLALETEVQVMQMQQNIPDKQQSKDLGETQFNIAQIYFILDQKQQAQEYCEQAILNLTQSLNEKDKLLKDVKKLQRKVFQNRTSKVLQDYEI